MTRWMTWLTAGALLAVGIGAVYVSTVGLGGTQAASSSYLTQAATLTSVTSSSAATGAVASARTYALAFGAEPGLADVTSSAVASDRSWTVDEVLVSVGDRVTTGQPLASAVTSELEAETSDTEASLELARLSLEEAQESLVDAKQTTRQQLVDATTAVEAARLTLANAKVARNDATAGNAVRQAKVAYIQAQDQLRSAKRLRDQLTEQLEGGYPAETIAVGQAEASVADLASQLDDLTDQLELAVIVAPVDGTVSEVALVAGLVAPSSAIVIDGATLEVVADVVESDVSAVVVGQPAVVTIDALGLDVQGTVTSVAPSTTGTSSSVVTFPVTVTLTDPPAQVRPGMSSDVEITIAEAADVIAVPAVALSGSDGSYSVQVATASGALETRPVTVGLVTETLAEITSGVAAGEEVLVGASTERVTSGEDEVSGFRGGGGLESLAGGGGPPAGLRPPDGAGQ